MWDWRVKSSQTHFRLWAPPCISRQWLERLKKGMRPSRKIILGAPARPHVLIWTDACNDNEYRGLGLVSVDTDASSPQRTMSADVCPPWLLTTFKAQCSSVICVLEMHAILYGLLSPGQEVRGRRVYFFCDNAAACEQHDHRLCKFQDNGSCDRALPPLRSSLRHRVVGGLGQHGHKHYRPTQQASYWARRTLKDNPPPLSSAPWISSLKRNSMTLHFSRSGGDRYLEHDNMVSHRHMSGVTKTKRVQG